MRPISRMKNRFGSMKNFSTQILLMVSLKMMDCIMLKSWQNARLMKTISEQ